MKTFKKILAILLVCVFIGTALVGCSKKKGPGASADASGGDASGNQQATETQKQTNIYGEPSFTGVVPTDELDFEGEDLTVIYRSGEIIEREWHKESPEDELDEAVAMRNAAVTETLNLSISYEVVPWGSYDESATRFNNMRTLFIGLLWRELLFSKSRCGYPPSGQPQQFDIHLGSASGGGIVCRQQPPHLRPTEQILFHQEREVVDVLQRHTRTPHDSPQGVFGNDEWDVGLFLEAFVEALDESTATCQIDAVFHNVGVEFGGYHLQHFHHSSVNLQQRFLQRIGNLAI